MEEWKQIPGFENLYEASNFGQIRTCEGKTTSSKRFEKRVWKQRILKQKWQNRKRSTNRDARVTLWKDGKAYTLLVARLIALTWCEGYEKGSTVNHINGNTEDNRAENLEWISLGDNIRHAFENNLISTARQCKIIDKDGNVIEFTSLSKADVFLNRHIGFLRNKFLRAKTKELTYNDYTIIIH